MYKNRYAFFTTLPTYSLDDCIKVVQDFYAEFSRVPSSSDITKLSKLNKSPSAHVFAQKGGLHYVIERAGLDSPGANKYYEPGQIIREFRRFVSDFRSKNDDRFPTTRECVKEFAVQPGTFESHTRMKYREALVALGDSPRKGKIYNESSLKKDGIK